MCWRTPSKHKNMSGEQRHDDSLLTVYDSLFSREPGPLTQTAQTRAAPRLCCFDALRDVGATPQPKISASSRWILSGVTSGNRKPPLTLAPCSWNS